MSIKVYAAIFGAFTACLSAGLSLLIAEKAPQVWFLFSTSLVVALGTAFLAGLAVATQALIDSEE